MTTEKLKQLFKDNGIFIGRMLSYSKSTYRKTYPDSEVYFNANIFTKNSGKIWWGDIDLTTEGETLQAIANQAGEDLFVLCEMDGRFENENLTFEEFKNRAVKFYLAS
jgi:hypothetical protein